MARLATREELRRPGFMERSFPSMGSSLLSSFAMGFVGSMVAHSFFSSMGGFGGEGTAQAAEPTAAEEQATVDDGSQDLGEGDGADMDVGGGDF